MRLIVVFICGFCRSAPVGVAHVNLGQFRDVRFSAGQT